MRRFLSRYWFVLGLLLVLLLAWCWPALAGGEEGALHPLWTKRGLVAAVFLLAGLNLRPAELLRALVSWRLHLRVQGYGLLLCPLLGLALDPFWAALGLEADLRAGLLVLCCLPCTITSCVVMTQAAGGRVGLALCNAVLGNLLGVIVVPLWVLLLVGRSGDLPLGPIVLELGLLVVTPILVGQVLVVSAGARLLALRREAGRLAQLLLLGLLLLVFARAFAEDARVSLGQLLVLLPGLVLLRLLLLAGAWLLGLGCTVGDRLAILFTASSKTLALGVPLIALMEPNPVRAAALTLPLMFFHPLMLLIDALLAARLGSRHE